MGSKSDAPTMKYAANALKDSEVLCETRVVSAHRTPTEIDAYVRASTLRNVQVVVAGAGGAAHLPGMVGASEDGCQPVIGIPAPSSGFAGIDSILSIQQMPPGVPVATMQIGKRGAWHGGKFAAKLVQASAVPEGDQHVLLLANSVDAADRLRPAREAMSGLNVRSGEVELISSIDQAIARMERAAHERIKMVIIGTDMTTRFAEIVSRNSALPVNHVPFTEGSFHSGTIDDYLQYMSHNASMGTMTLNGAKNAGLYAARVVAMSDQAVRSRYMTAHIPGMIADVAGMNQEFRDKGSMGDYAKPV